MRSLPLVLNTILSYIPSNESTIRERLIYELKCVDEYPPELHLKFWESLHKYFYNLKYSSPTIPWNDIWQVWLGHKE